MALAAKREDRFFAVTVNRNQFVHGGGADDAGSRDCE